MPDLLRAIEIGDLNEVIKDLDAGRNIESRYMDGRTILSIACTHGRIEIAKALLDRGADVDAASSHGNWSPLHYAAGMGHVDIVELLLDRRANVEAMTDKGRTPLLWACGNGQIKTALALLKRGASVEARNEFGRTALICACDNGRNECALMLASYGASITYKDKEGRSALDYAKKRGFDQELLSAAANARENITKSHKPLHLYLLTAVVLVAAIFVYSKKQCNDIIFLSIEVY
jgi:uncharacterized protein